MKKCAFLDILIIQEKLQLTKIQKNQNMSFFLCVELKQDGPIVKKKEDNLNLKNMELALSYIFSSANISLL